MSIIDLIEGDGGTLNRAATTNGGEFAGACPWCGGNDRFLVWPEQDGGRYWCRSCGKAGDSIQYLRERRAMSFVEACRYLGRDPGPRKNGPRPTPAAWEPKEAPPRAAAWQERARSFLDGAIEALWSRRGDGARQWLHAEKGLSDSTIRAASLGLALADKYEPRGTWGLDPSLKEDGAERRQWLPGGLVIPCIGGGAVSRLRIRRDNPGDGARYVIVSGSSSAPITWNLERAVAVIVESELDGLLLNQESGDLAGVVAMGTATAKPDRITHEALMSAAVILVSLDTDNAGAKASWQFWPETYGGKVKRWPCVGGKDPSDARLGGLDLRSWVVTGIFGTGERFERFCIQTIGGGLSDEEAIVGRKRC
ncbi:MAG: zinc-binding protein [Proteobacteria bacterium]|nr:zinc-binding protein [Pseudomonadota bacterium]